MVLSLDLVAGLLRPALGSPRLRVDHVQRDILVLLASARGEVVGHNLLDFVLIIVDIVLLLILLVVMLLLELLVVMLLGIVVLIVMELLLLLEMLLVMMVLLIVVCLLVELLWLHGRSRILAHD